MPAGTPEPESADVPAEDATPEDAAPEEVPMNRAERRAKGRKSGAVPPGRSNLPGRGSPVSSPRQWTNRRGGG
jgi:hypothetical protein